MAVPYNGMNVPDYVLERIAAESKYGLSTVSMEELRSLAGGIDALYLTPNAPHQMALFTADMPLDGAPPPAAAPAALDAFYLTRLQRERMGDKEDDGGKYGHFDARALKTSRTHEAVVMHPLPRTDELAYELDSDPRAVWPLRAGRRRRAGADGAHRVAARAKWHRAPASAPPCRDSLQGASGPALRQPRDVSTATKGCTSRTRFRRRRSTDSSTLPLVCEFCERELRIEFVGHTRTRRYYRFDRNLYGYVQPAGSRGSLAVFESVKQAEESGYEPIGAARNEIMNTDEVAAACRALAAQIAADLPDLASVTIVGVVSHGAMLAMRLRDLIEAETHVRPPCVALDVFGGERRSIRSTAAD